MGYLIPQMTLMDFQKLCENDVKNMRSIVIVGIDGDYLATLLVPQTDYIKVQAEYMGEMSNGVKPKWDDVISVGIHDNTEDHSGTIPLSTEVHSGIDVDASL